jgi:hypothetical protein
MGKYWLPLALLPMSACWLLLLFEVLSRNLCAAAKAKRFHVTSALHCKAMRKRGN